MIDDNSSASIQLQSVQQCKIEQLNARLREQFAEYDMLMDLPASV